MNDQEFFYSLLKETEKVFSTSPIKRKQDDLNQKWNYSVCATPILRNKGVIFGLNWGGNNSESQSEYPHDKDIESYRFIESSLGLLKKYFRVDSIYSVNYTNMCFFRSPGIQYLTNEDWNSAVPLFKSYIQYINPPWAILLGTTGIQYLKNSGAVPMKLEQLHVPYSKKTVFGYCGKLFDHFPFAGLPHPQARISPEARANIWEVVASRLELNSNS